MNSYKNAIKIGECRILETSLTQQVDYLVCCPLFYCLKSIFFNKESNDKNCYVKRIFFNKVVQKCNRSLRDVLLKINSLNMHIMLCSVRFVNFKPIFFS